MVMMSPGLYALPLGQVVGRGDDAGDAHRQRQHRRRLDRADHRRGAAHVELHLLHLLGRLDGDAAGVEGDAFADQRDMLLRFARRVLQDDEARLFDRAAVDGQQAAHLHLLDLAPAVDRALDADVFRHFLGALGR